MAKATRTTIVKNLSRKPAQRMHIFRELDANEQARVLTKLTNYIRGEIVSNLDETELQLLLEQLDPVTATDVLQLLPKKKREAVLTELTEELRKDVSVLLSFDPDTAAGIMSLEYIQIHEDATIADVIEKVQLHEKKTGKIPTIIVEDATGLHSFLPMHKLALAKTNEKARNHTKKIATLHYTNSQKDVLQFFKNHPHTKAVVLGERKNVLGVIYSDDVLRLINEQASASLYDFAGVRAEETVFDSLKRKVQFRYKWLIINLGTTFLAAFTVGLFDSIIAQEVLLAVYMPIVAGMGGNSGTQTMAVMVRGLSQQDLELPDIMLALRNEVGAALVNGVINGAIVFAIVSIFNHNVLVASVLAAAMIINLLVAATFGTIVPVIMKRLGKDPASSATIFITTATDIFGFLAFLGLASLLLS